MALKNLYRDIYQRFLDTRDAHEGYDFQDATSGSVPPPNVTFQEKLKWWTLNRPNRLKKIARERDRRQQEILDLKTPPRSPSS